MADDPVDKPSEDVVFLHSPTEDGQGINAIRKRDDRIELCSLRAAKDGEPIRGELASLKPRPDSPRLFDVDVHYKAPDAEHAPRASDPPPAVAAPTPPPSLPPGEIKKPARVATETYRNGWDRIWGKKPTDLPN